MKKYYEQLKKLLKNAYAPYSKFHTAALVETDKGNFIGVNVENAAYPVTICAERNAIFNAISNGAKTFKALYLISSSARVDITPCGSCRQVINEFFDGKASIHCYNIKGIEKIYLVKDLLPNSFNKKQLGH